MQTAALEKASDRAWPPTRDPEIGQARALCQSPQGGGQGGGGAAPCQRRKVQVLAGRVHGEDHLGERDDPGPAAKRGKCRDYAVGGLVLARENGMSGGYTTKQPRQRRNDPGLAAR